MTPKDVADLRKYGAYPEYGAGTDPYYILQAEFWKARDRFLSCGLELGQPERDKGEFVCSYQDAAGAHELRGDLYDLLSQVLTLLEEMEQVRDAKLDALPTPEHWIKVGDSKSGGPTFVPAESVLSLRVSPEEPHLVMTVRGLGPVVLPFETIELAHAELQRIAEMRNKAIRTLYTTPRSDRDMESLASAASLR